MVQPGVWDDPARAGQMAREAAELRQLVAGWDRLEKRARDLIELDQLADGDPELEQQLSEEKASIAHELRSRELDLLFTDPYANHNAVVTLSVGQGGVEAQDWVEMLMRMYLKWAERKGFETEILETSPGEEAGLKSATFIVRGPRAYGLLRSEHGVHRLVRISPFDQNRRTCGSTRTAPQARADSTSTRRTRQCASRTCLLASWSPARTSDRR